MTAVAQSPTYRIVVKACTSYNPINLTPAGIIAIFDKATNIGYSEIVGNIPQMFFTLSQDDVDALATVAATGTNVFGYGSETAVPLHFLVYRNNELVWAGLGPMELDENKDDLIVYSYGYAASFYWTLTGWKQEYTSQTIKQIVDDVITKGKAKTHSMMNWLTTGTTEAPVTTSGGGTAITLPYYVANYKRILFLFREMASYAASDTTNRVWFEVTPSGTINFWKNAGSTLKIPAFTYPRGNVLSFSRYRMPVDMRTKLYGVGTSPTDVALQSAQENTDLSNRRGLREDSIYLQWVRDSDELARVTKRRLTIANKVDKQLVLTLAPNSVAPIRASAGLQMMADYPVNIKKGSVQYSGQQMCVGNQVLFVAGREYVRPVFQDVPS